MTRPRRSVLRTRHSVLLSLLLSLASFLPAAASLPPDVPASPAAPVTDLAGLLSSGTRARLDEALRAQWQAGHFQLAVLTLPSIGDQAIEDVGIRVARAWGLGGKDTDNGVLLLIAKQERKLRIEVGQKLEGTLTDVACKRIIEDVMKPSLRRGDFDQAVLDGAAAITAAVAPEDPLAAQAPPAAGAGLASAGLLVVLLVWFLGHPFALILALLLLQVVLGMLARKLGFRSSGRGGWGGGGWGGGGSGWGGGGGGGFSGGGGGFSGGGSSGSW